MIFKNPKLDCIKYFLQIVESFPKIIPLNVVVVVMCQIVVITVTAATPVRSYEFIPDSLTFLCLLFSTLTKNNYYNLNY